MKFNFRSAIESRGESCSNQLYVFMSIILKLTSPSHMCVCKEMLYSTRFTERTNTSCDVSVSSFVVIRMHECDRIYNSRVLIRESR